MTFDNAVTFLLKTAKEVGLLRNTKQQIAKGEWFSIIALMRKYFESVHHYEFLEFFCQVMDPQRSIFSPLGVCRPHFENHCNRQRHMKLIRPTTSTK